MASENVVVENTVSKLNEGFDIPDEEKNLTAEDLKPYVGKKSSRESG